jgi:hypothetical protein
MQQKIMSKFKVQIQNFPLPMEERDGVRAKAFLRPL